MISLLPPPVILFGAMAILTFALACVIQYSDSLINCLNLKTSSLNKPLSYRKIPRNLETKSIVYNTVQGEKPKNQ